jgi:hypothetical protein
LTIKVQDEDDPEDWDYEFASIYNWKDGRVPLETYSWHVGGFKYDIEDLVAKILDGDIEPVYSEVA